MTSEPGARPVVVVTGGGGGIGAAIATEIGRQGSFVVTVDPLVSLDGSERLPPTEETTAARIVAAGGAARASSASVTDAHAVTDLFHGLLAEHGRLDAVVNVAGITRPTTFATGTDEDWREVVAVHLGGYLNVLGAALPIMASAGRGRILGVTSGSGWRPSDTGAYGCAKRAVAALTWQLGRTTPPGVAVNALSPIAVTRMVTAALARAQTTAGGGSGSGSATSGLSLGSLPEPDQLGPIGAHLVAGDRSWCRGQVLFAAGSEVAVVEAPALLEVVATDGARSLAHLLEAASAGALVPAEARQTSVGGTNPRFASAFDAALDELPRPEVRTCAVVASRVDVGAAVVAALTARGVSAAAIVADGPGFAGATATLAAAVERLGRLDALVVAPAGGVPGRPGAARSDGGWEGVLAEHAALVEQIPADAAWCRAVADLAVTSDRPLRLVTLVDATTAGGRSRAQAAAQLSRAARPATRDRVSAFAVSVEVDDPAVGEVAAHLVCSPGSPALSGAELALGDGWYGVRRHPRPSGSISFHGPGLPRWFDDVLRDVVDPA